MENQRQIQKIPAFLLAAAGVVMFSSKAIFVKKAYEYDIDTVSLLLIRMGIALPIYVVIAIVSSVLNKDNRLTKKDFIWLLLLGFLGYYLASFFDFHGLQFISASLERLILFIYPTLVLIISSIFLRKTITIQQKIAIVLTYIGVILAFYKYGNYNDNSNLVLGAGLIFASALSYAIYLVGSGNIIPRLGSVRFTSFAMIVSCVAVILHYLLNHKQEVSILSYPPEVYKLGMAMAFISTIIPSFLLGEAIKQLGAPNVAIVGSIGPISTIILAAIFLGEHISYYQFAGTVVVIAGVLLIALNKKPKFLKK